MEPISPNWNGRVPFATLRVVASLAHAVPQASVSLTTATGRQMEIGEHRNAKLTACQFRMAIANAWKASLLRKCSTASAEGEIERMVVPVMQVEFSAPNCVVLPLGVVRFLLASRIVIATGTALEISALTELLAEFSRSRSRDNFPDLVVRHDEMTGATVCFVEVDAWDVISVQNGKLLIDDLVSAIALAELECVLQQSAIDLSL